MTVRLAAQVLKDVGSLCTYLNIYNLLQVLSSSVANAFSTLRDLKLMKGTEETQKFCIMFDRYFDMMNTRAIDEGLRQRKPDPRAYENVDFRYATYIVMYVCSDVYLILQWLEETFLKYIKDWEAYVQSKDKIPKIQKQFCMLLKQTTSGLFISGKVIRK